MTLLEINLTDVLSETDPNDVVKVWAPVMREGPAGQLVGTRKQDIPLVDGVGSDEVVPGPLMVQVQCKGISDSHPREVVVPDQVSVTLADLFRANGFKYTEPMINDAKLAADRAEAAALVFDDAQVVTDARDDAVTAAVYAEGIATALPATIQSELDTRVPPAVSDALAADATIISAAQDAVYAEVNAGLPGKADTTYVDALVPTATAKPGQVLEMSATGTVWSWADRYPSIYDTTY